MSSNRRIERFLRLLTLRENTGVSAVKAASNTPSNSRPSRLWVGTGVGGATILQLPWIANDNANGEVSISCSKGVHAATPSSGAIATALAVVPLAPADDTKKLLGADVLAAASVPYPEIQYFWSAFNCTPLTAKLASNSE